jgi:hypothetical protein
VLGLTIVHAEPLPPALGAAPSAERPGYRS